VRSLDAADLIVIAGRTLGIGTDAALAQLDVAATQAALAMAGTGRRAAGVTRGLHQPDAGRAAIAAACVRLMHALLSQHAFPENNAQVATAAGLQFLSLNGWQADLEPPATAAVVIEALASGQLAPDAAAAWLTPRLSPARPGPLARPARLTPARRLRRGVGVGTGTRAPRRPSTPRATGGRRLAASVLLAIALSGVGILAAACSRVAMPPAAPAGGNPPAVTVCPSPPAAKSLPGRPASAVSVTPVSVTPASVSSVPDAPARSGVEVGQNC
jgi:hypothetical protein